MSEAFSLPPLWLGKPFTFRWLNLADFRSKVFLPRRMSSAFLSAVAAPRVIELPKGKVVRLLIQGFPTHHRVLVAFLRPPLRLVEAFDFRRPYPSDFRLGATGRFLVE